MKVKTSKLKHIQRSHFNYVKRYKLWVAKHVYIGTKIYRKYASELPNSIPANLNYLSDTPFPRKKKIGISGATWDSEDERF